MGHPSHLDAMEPSSPIRADNTRDPSALTLWHLFGDEMRRRTRFVFFFFWSLLHYSVKWQVQSIEKRKIKSSTELCAPVCLLLLLDSVTKEYQPKSALSPTNWWIVSGISWAISESRVPYRLIRTPELRQYDALACKL